MINATAAMAPARRGGRGWGSSAKNNRTGHRLQKLATIDEARQLSVESLECVSVENLQPATAPAASE
eukprot:1810541-Pleurochrysis_carterae.AAC.1